MRRHKRSITFSFIIPDSAFKFRTQMLREHIFPETDAAPPPAHTHPPPVLMGARYDPVKLARVPMPTVIC